MKDNDWKKRLGMVYSTNPDFAFTTDDDINDEPIATLPPERQRLRLQLEKSGRAGKTVTVIKGFTGSDDDLMLHPGANTVTIKTQRACSVRLSARGRWL